jgi:hypothetical protein
VKCAGDNVVLPFSRRRIGLQLVIARSQHQQSAAITPTGELQPDALASRARSVAHEE